MADLEVDLEGLDALAAQLHRIRAQLDAGRRTLDATRSDLGSHDVAAALDHFEDHWEDGRESIDENGKTLATMVTESVKAYRDADRELARGLTESMQGTQVTVPHGAAR